MRSAGLGARVEAAAPGKNNRFRGTCKNSRFERLRRPKGFRPFGIPFISCDAAACYARTAVTGESCKGLLSFQPKIQDKTVLSGRPLDGATGQLQKHLPRRPQSRESLPGKRPGDRAGSRGSVFAENCRAPKTYSNSLANQRQRPMIWKYSPGLISSSVPSPSETMCVGKPLFTRRRLRNIPSP